MQLEHVIVGVFVLMFSYQLCVIIARWIRDLPVPPDPWDALLSFLRKEKPVALHQPAGNAPMKRLLTDSSWSGIEVNLLKGLLEEEGIPCLIKNEMLSIAVGDIPPAECYPQLWLLDVGDYPRAQEILEAWRTAAPVPAGEEAG